MKRSSSSVVSGWINQKIEIRANDAIPDGAGGVIPNNEPYWSTNAKMRQLRSTRRSEANQSPIKMVWECQIRYRNDKNINDGMQVKWRGLTWVIMNYVPDLVYQEYVNFDIIQSNPGNLVIPLTT